MSTVSPQRMTTDDVFQTVEQSGGGPLLIPPPPGDSTEWTEEIMAEDTSGRECPHDYFGIRPRTGTIEMSEDRVPIRNIESPYGGGVRSLPGAAENRLPVMFPTASVLRTSAGFLAGDSCAGRGYPCRGCFQTGVSRAKQNGERPIDLSDVAGNVRPALPAGCSSLAGLVKSVGPVGPFTIPSPYVEKTLEPLEHMVLIQADPAGQPSAVGTLSPSDCYTVGPAGPYVAGGPVGPDVYFTDPNSSTQMVRIHADPAGQDATATGTPSLSNYYPAGPAGLYVAGGPVGPDVNLPALESCEHLVLDHADPAGQHAVDLDTMEYAVVENILDGRPMEGITCPELLEYSL